MKIVRNTPEQLIVRYSPWFLGALFIIFIIGAVAFGFYDLSQGDQSSAYFKLIGLPIFFSIFMVAFVRRDELILDRTRDLIELRHSTFRGRTKIRHDLQYLKEAILQFQEDEDGKKIERVALVLDGGMDAGVHPITPVYTNGSGPRRAKRAITLWLAKDVDSAPPEA